MPFFSFKRSNVNIGEILKKMILIADIFLSENVCVCGTFVSINSNYVACSCCIFIVSSPPSPHTNCQCLLHFKQLYFHITKVSIVLPDADKQPIM